jgi:predicted RNase H-like nuclease (RuvC/YqgF family)
MKILAVATVGVCLACASGYAQERPSTNDTSLGDIARKLKAQKAKERPPVIVVTNDNLTSSAPEPMAKTTTDAAAPKPSSPAPDRGAPYFRAQQRKLQDQLDTHKRELAVLQQKLGQNQMQYYPDPNKSLQQQYSRTDINKLTADIDAKKQQIADDEKALDDLSEQLRREGGDPSWLR